MAGRVTDREANDHRPDKADSPVKADSPLKAPLDKADRDNKAANPVRAVSVWNAHQRKSSA